MLGAGLRAQRLQCPAQERDTGGAARRSEEHTSELQSRLHLVCRLLLEKKKEAAPIDGTRAWQRFRHLPWPLLTPLTMCLVHSSVIHTLAAFQLVYVLTGNATPQLNPHF